MTDAPAPTRLARDEERTRRILTGLRRRSLFIHFWRGALPAVIAAGLLGLLGWAGYKTFSELNLSGKQGGAIRMVNPEFHGRNKAGLPYLVTAQSAVRDTEHQELILLTEPRLLMKTLTRGDVHGASRSGRYDENSNLLNLWGGVTLTDALGYHFESPTARVDTKASTAEGHDGTHDDGPLGRAVGDAYFIDDKSGHTVLTGHVRTHLVPHTVGHPGPTP